MDTGGGIRGRTEATGLGTYYGLKEAVSNKEDMDKLGLTTGIEGKTVVIQGMGNVGYWAAKFFHEAGAKVIGLLEYEGGIYDKNGLDPDKVMKHRKKTGSILKYPKAKSFKNSMEGLEIECDILIPAALENVITKANARKIKAKIIGEAANGPITSAADNILNKKGVMTIPDMYLNAGGVTVSYFEWLKNLSHVRFGRMDKRFHEYTQTGVMNQMEKLTGGSVSRKAKEKIIAGPSEQKLVYSGLEDTMISAYQDIRAMYKRKRNIKDLRTAAFAVSIEKIAESYLALGIFP